MIGTPLQEIATPASIPPSSGISIGPFLLKGVKLLGGSFSVAPGLLRALSAQIFGSESDFAPVTGEIFFDFGRVPQGALGRDSEPWSFLAIRMLVGRERNGTSELRAVVTHAFVDRDRATMLGREVFGFPAIPATFSPLRDGKPVDPKERDAELDRTFEFGGEIEILTDALRENDPRVRPSPIVALTVAGPADARFQGESESHWIWEAVRATAEREDGAAISFAQLKQLRDAIDPTRACFQDIVEGTLKTNHDRDSVPAAASIAFYDYPSFRLGSGFGGNLNARLEFGCEKGYRVTDIELNFTIPKSTRLEPVTSGRNGAPFRFRSGDPQFAPEYEFHNVKLTGFKVPVRRSRVKELVDKLLNEPFPRRNYRYEPTSADIIIECLDYGSMMSANPPPGLRSGDSAGQRELLFRVLVGRVDQGSSVAQDPAMFCPFLYVDSAWSFISGREIVGYPKQLAVFRRYEEDGEIAGCRIEAPDKNGAPARVLTFDCRAERTVETMDAILDGQENEDLVTSAGVSAALPRPLRADQPWWDLADLQGLAGLDSFVRPWLRGGSNGYGAVQLKRFAEAQPTENACYLEVLEGDYMVRNMQGTLPLYRASLHFPRPVGDPPEGDPFGIMAAFGLNQNVLVPAGSWYRATCDFRLRIRDPLA